MSSAELKVVIFGQNIIDPQRFCFGVNPFRRAPKEAHLRSFLHEIDLPHETVWQGDVIGVPDGDVLPFCEKASCIESLGRSQ